MVICTTSVPPVTLPSPPQQEQGSAPTPRSSARRRWRNLTDTIITARWSTAEESEGGTSLDCNLHYEAGTIVSNPARHSIVDSRRQR